MIITIESSIPTFKTIHFQKGLNVVLADTRPDATEKQTRNSAGKTSLIEIIHFLLGGNCGTESLFRTAALVESTFSGTFLIGGETYTVERGGSMPSRIFILQGGQERTDLPKKKEKASGRTYVSNKDWRIFLGHNIFNMPAVLEGSAFEESFTPTFRAMFAYFARRWHSGAFLHPEKQAEQQRRWDWQVNLSYLLGLDWQIPFEFQKVRDREQTLSELKKAAKGGAFGDVLGTVAELRPQVAIAEAKTQRRRNELTNFEVLHSYRDLSRQAAHTKTKMQRLSRQAVVFHETLDHLSDALAAESPPERSDLQRLYSAVGIELPGVSLRRFEDVTRFYDSVVENRRAHLEQEIRDAQIKIDAGDAKLVSLDAERRDILKALEGRGALEDFLDLQRGLAELEATAAALRERFKAAEILEGKATQLKIDRANLKQRLQQDYHHRKATLEEAILIIADAINELYDDRSGEFVVEATDNGPEFRITIEGDRGAGISSIEVFCLDFALLKLVTKRLGGPGFLIHDSHLFDGVDERQVARALLLGWRVAEEQGVQYIVTMNSDIYDRLPLPDEIDRAQAVLDTRLSDETDTGGLFGFRFE